MTENEHQIALRKWIHAGLAIAGVRKRKGDAGYIINNMIAKYTLYARTYRISVEAERVLRRNGVSLRDEVRRGAIYGKTQPTVYEHAVPAVVVRGQLLKSSRTMHTVRQILEAAGPVAIILREEDDMLNEAGLSRRMPESWKWGDNVLDRYRKAGVTLTSLRVKMTGAVKR